jgi:hypothetical protein
MQHRSMKLPEQRIVFVDGKLLFSQREEVE